MKRYSKKGLEKRKQEREGFKEFYEENIKKIKKEHLFCQECGCKLVGDVSEVVHILEKQKFKSIACNFKNILYLCSWKSGCNNCHSIFDGSAEQLQSMKIFKQTQETVKELLEEVEEDYNYKILDKWQL